MSLEKSVNQAAFDTFDPDNFGGDTMSDLYDPDYLDKQTNGSANILKNARPGVKLQLNISITNSTAQNIKTELFSAYDSWTTRLKSELAVATYSMIPLYTYEGLAALIAAPTGGNSVGFNQAGDLEVRGNAGQAKLTVGCGEYPYVSVFEATKTLPFYNAYLRYTVSTDAQIDNTITHFTKTIGGGVKENRISPRAYFKPNQYQNKTIDLIAPFKIDGESGLSVTVLAGEQLRFAFFISQWGSSNV